MAQPFSTIEAHWTRVSRALAVAVLLGISAVASGQTHNWQWSRAMSSTAPERFREVAIDPSDGGIYSIGDAQNGAGALLGAVNMVNQNQALLVKYSDDGALIWTAVIGGTSDETGEAVAVGPNGVVYATGTFKGTCHFYNAGGTTSAGLLTAAGGTDIYLAAYTAQGMFLWARRVGNGSDELNPQVCADASGVYLAGDFISPLAVGGFTSAPALNSGTHDIFLIRYDLAGAVQWMITGGGPLPDSAANIASDGTRVVVGLVSGHSNFRWYNSTGTQISNSSSGSQNDHHICAFTNAGIALWDIFIADPTSNTLGYPNIALGCEGVYLAGGTAPGSAISSGSTATGSTGASVAYVARLNWANGAPDWALWGTSTGNGSTFAARDIAIGRNGAVHVVGTYGGTIGISTSTATSSDTEDLFALTLRPNGSVALFETFNTPETQQAWGIAADQLGGIAMVGAFQTGITIPGNSLTGPNNLNAFVAFARVGPRGPAIQKGSLFNAPSALCIPSGVIDLSNWAISPITGNAIAVPAPGGASNAANMIGAPDGLYASIGSGLSVMVDLGTVVPEGEQVVMRWRMNSVAMAIPVISAWSSADAAAWTAHTSTYSTSSTGFAYAYMPLPTATRYLRLTSNVAGSISEVDAFMYSFGTLAGGVWSGPGVSGNLWNPNGLSGPISITYTYGNAPCAQVTTRVISVDVPPVAGSISVSPANMQCPGMNSGAVSLSGHTGNVVNWELSTDGFMLTGIIPTADPVVTYTNLTVTTAYRARIATGCGSIYSETAVVVIGDTIAPFIQNCPSDLVLHVPTTGCAVQYTWPTLHSTDDCDPDTESGYSTWLTDEAQGTLTEVTGETDHWFTPGAYTVREEHMDDSGNSSVCHWTITVLDTVPPIITCPGSQDLPADASTCSALVTWSAPTVLENCTAFTLTQTTGLPNGSNFPVGDHFITYKVVDLAGLSATCAFQVSVTDDSPPVISCPLDITVNADAGSCGAVVSYSPPVGTDNCNIASTILTAGLSSGSVFPVGTTTVTHQVTDAAGLTAGCSFTVTVVDNNSPTITCPGNMTVTVDAASCGAMVNYNVPVGTDNCGGATTIRTSGPASGSMFPVGTTTVTHLVTDAAGLTASCSFTVTVEDHTAPVITGCPSAALSFNTAANSCSAVVNWNPPVAADNCPGVSMLQTGGPAIGSIVGVGTYIITYAAQDAAGNISTCSFNVNVVDNVQPSFTGCPEDIAVNAPSGACGAIVTYTPPTATDNCPGVSVTRTAGLASGSFFPVGTTVVTHTAASPNGPNATCTFWVTVFDAEAPVLSNCSPVSSGTTSGCTATVTYPSPTVTGNCSGCVAGAPANTTFVGTYQGRTYFLSSGTARWSVANNTAIAAGGHLAVVRDAAMNAWLRNAVTAAAGSAVSYWIGLNDVAVDGTWRWTNSAPVSYTNFDTGEPNNLGGNEDYAEVKSNGFWNDEKNATSRRYVIEVEASCNTPQLTAGLASGSAFPLGASTVQFSATDAAGNSANCSFTVTVTDNTAPTISCPANIVVNADAESCGAVINYTAPAGVDNCSGATTTLIAGLPSGALFPKGTTTVTHQVTDATGLSASCSFTVTVVDNTPPAIICSGNIDMPADTALCGVSILLPAPLITDNCPGSSYVQTAGPPSGTVFPIGIHTITYTVTDGAGLQNSCSFTVSVTDSDAPSVWCPLYDEYPLLLSGPGCTLSFPDLRDSLSVSDCSAWTNAMSPAPGTVFSSDTLVNMTMWIVDAHGNGLWNNHTIRISGQTSNSTMASACGSYTWAVNGNTYGASGTYTYVNGCHTETLILTITPSTSNTTTASACDNYTWAVDGNTYSASGTYTHVVGCHTETLVLTITTPGGSCDDGDPATGNDIYLADCSCAGQLIDCAGVVNGTANMDACGICSGGNTGIVPNSACTDCAGVVNGTASVDACGICSGGNTGIVPNSACTDCAGVVNGTASVDACGICAGGTTGIVPNSACTDCAGVVNGTASVDACGICSGGNTGIVPNSACTDCAGVVNGTASVDACGICAGGTTGIVPNSACTDCAGVVNGTASLDACGICSGGNTGIVPNSACTDCAGVVNGTASVDACGICSGGNTGIVPNSACTDCAGVVNGTASVDACGICAGGTTGIVPNSACTDCAGVVNGTANVDACGICAGGTTGIVPNSTCTDCAGVVNGTASVDACGICSGGNTGIIPNSACTDCAGVVNGTASLDACGICSGGNTGIVPNSACTDCAGVVNGTASLDACGICSGGNTGIVPNSACTDCAGVVNGTANVDACGICSGGNTGIVPNSACTDCAGVVNGTANVDACGICAGGNTGIVPNSTCTDCAGVVNGTASVDACGICSGGNTGIVPNSACTDCAGVVNGTASVDACGICAGGTTGIVPNSACTDCAGVVNGTANVDACGICAGGTTGIVPNSTCTDCAGVVNGTATVDACGICAGGTTGIVPNSACTDCAGVVNGTASVDACGICAGGTTGIVPNSACTDCAGVVNGTANVDACGICAGGTTGIVPNSTCTDCAGVVNGTASVDACGICSGGNTGIVPNSACTDCAGVVNGTANVDACGICAGGNTGIVPNSTCTDCAGVVNGTASLDACGICSGGNTGIVPNSACTDCAGVVNGTSLPGTPCDDANPNTINDAWGANCNCSGTLVDCSSDAGSDQVICGTIAQLNAQGQGTWSTPSGISLSSTSDPLALATAASPGSYELLWAVTVGSCVGIDTVNITFIAVQDAAFAYAQSAYCLGDPTPSPWVAQPGGGFTASPSGIDVDALNGTINLSTSQPGEYLITYSFSGSCPSSSTQSITVAADADAGWTPPIMLCSDSGPVDLNSFVTGTPGGSWSGQGVTAGMFNPAGLSGVIPITYTTMLGSCTAQLTQGIQITPSIGANAGPDVSVCGLRAVMAALGSGVWTLPAGISSADPLTDPNATISAQSYGSYTLTWTAAQGSCTATDQVVVTFIEPSTDLWVDAGADQNIAVVDHANLTGSASPGATLNWWVLSGQGTIVSPADSSTVIEGLAIGDNYIVLTATANICSSISDTVLIHLDDLFIPQGFSPNGDGVNDRWVITGMEAYPGSDLNVFNRWGQLVFESASYANEWDGRSRNGRSLPDDTYFYVLNLNGLRSYNGHVILKR